MLLALFFVLVNLFWFGAFGTATVVTNVGLAMLADRVRTTPGTYTNPPKYSAIGTGATGAARTAAVTDIYSTMTQSGSRVSGTEGVATTNTTGDTHTLSATHTAGGTIAVDEAMILDASTTGNVYVSATFAVINMILNDTLSLAWSVVLDQA